MTHASINDKPKLILFASGPITIPVIRQLLQTEQLAGVVVSARQHPETQFFLSQLQQTDIPCQTYNESNPEQLLPLIDQWQAQAGLIYTFSHVLPESIIQAFNLGLYNLHASPLPKYRGPMPLYWQIRHQQTQSCLTIIKVDQSVDSGDIVFQQPLPLNPGDTLNTLATTLSAQAPECIARFLEKLAVGDLQPQPQTGEATPAPVPTPEDLMVDWHSMNSQNIAAMARAGNPQFNGATLKWRQSQMALLQATPVEHPGYGVEPGTVLHVGEPEGLIVANIDGALRLDVIIVTEGVFSGLAFAERFELDAGMLLG